MANTQPPQIITTQIVPTVIVPKFPITPTMTFPIVPKPITPTFQGPVISIPTTLVPTFPTFQKPVTPAVLFPPKTPTVPTVIIPTFQKPITPTVPFPPKTPTITQPVIPTVMIPTFQKPMTPTVPAVMFPPIVQPVVPTIAFPQKPIVPTVMVTQPTVFPTIVPALPPIVTKPVTPGRTKVRTPTFTTNQFVQQIINFTPEMIDEDTIIEYANTLNQANFLNLLKLLDDYYHNEEGLVGDDVYDELLDIYNAKYGPYRAVGAEPRREKVKLPYFLSSLRKLKKEEELKRWLDNFPGPYIIEDKIDGITLLLVSTTVQGRRQTSLYTRGHGVEGMDVSHLLNYMRFPPINIDIAIRGEAVFTKEAFARVGGGYKNARNLVSGVVSAKKQFNPELARELSFFPYRILTQNLTPEEDINELRRLGFQVPSPVAAETLTKEILENYFKTRKEQAPYEMDGLVIYQNRVGEYPVGDEPRHVVAFKTATESLITTVTHVEWNPSKHFLLKPIVHYETVHLSGADLNKASGYNGRFIVTNNIGPGARILLTRSGDVIPKILSVLTPAPGGPAWPDPNIHGKYDWNDNQVELVITERTDAVVSKQLEHFISTLGVKHMGPARVKLMVEAGLKSIADLMAVTPQQLASIPGIGTTISNQFYNDIHTAAMNISLARIMDASDIFPGIGERRFNMILDVYPNLLEMAYNNPREIAAAIRQVKGFDALADTIGGLLGEFADWLKQHPMITIQKPMQVQPQFVQPRQFIPPEQFLTLQPRTVPNTIPQPGLTLQFNQPAPQAIQQQYTQQGPSLAGMTIVFSGFRDKNLEDRIRAKGGRVTTSVSRNTSMLILKDMNAMKGKANEAQELGVQIISKADFESRYL